MRVDGDPLGYAPAVQRIVRAVDPDQPTRLIRSMTEFIGLTVGDRRQQTTLLVVFGALALVIASLGLYGLLAQTVSARGREIGIRMALGATWRNVMQMVMSRGIVLTGAGVGIGAVLAWSVTRAMETLLYGVGAADPLTFALVAGLLADRVRRGVRDSGRARGSRRSDAGLARPVVARNAPKASVDKISCIGSPISVILSSANRGGTCCRPHNRRLPPSRRS